MVRINDTFDFKVYSWDTLQIVVERLAARMDTLPKYLYISLGEDPNSLMERLKENNNVRIGDLLADIKSQELLQLPDLLTLLADPSKSPKFLMKKRLDIIGDVITPFIAYRTDLEKISPEQRAPLLLLLKKKIPRNVGTIPTEQLWSKRDSTKTVIERNITRNQENVKRSQVLATEKSLPHTKFTLKEVALEIELDFKNLTLLEVFDSIKLTPKIPFASVNNLYKILRDFTPNSDWGSSEGVIYLKVLETLPSSPREYFDVVLVMEGEVGEEKGRLQTSLIRLKKGITEYIFLHDLRKIFFPRLPFTITQRKIVKEKGKLYYLLGKKPIDAYVFGDLVLNDPVFSKYLAIDDSAAASKGKRSTIYIHFLGGSEEQNVKADLTVYQVRIKDEAHRKYGYPLREYYLNVGVRSVKNEAVLEDFILVFGKLLSLYYQRAPAIIKIYQNLLSPAVFPPKYKPRAPPPKGKKTHTPLSKQAPDVFIAGYPTKCTHQPHIISAQEAEAEKRAVMQYPKTADEGFVQRWYVCDTDPGYPYPGLRTNDLSNSDIVPFLPCCFKTQQDWGPKGVEGKHTKIYGHYFYDLPLIDKTGTSQQHIIVRDIFTNPPKFGELPNQLQETLDLITYRKGWSFIRSGVFDSKTSFLECVLEALQTYDDREGIGKYLEYGSKKTVKAYKALKKARAGNVKKEVIIQAIANLWEAKKEERLNLLNKLRQELAIPKNATGCSQEMYDYSEEEILQAISDPEVYFNPRLLINLVEKYFLCRVILFSRVVTGSQGQEYRDSFNTSMVLPRHVQAYYKTREEVPTILIYERLGRGSEQKVYPRCELISFWNGDTKIVSAHAWNSRISLSIQNLYERLRESYSLNCLVPQTVLPLNKLVESDLKLTHQEIDSYGKCRTLIFKYGDQVGALLTTPIQPLLLPRFRGGVTPRLSLKAAKEVLKKLGVKTEQESVTNFHVSAFSSRIGNTRFSLPFDQEGTEIILNKEIEEDLISRDQVGSHLHSYINDKRIARYMVEYIRWLYSSFLRDRKDEDSVENLHAFIKDHIVVDAKFKYDPIAKNFSVNSGLTKNGKLYVKSKETMKRLIYTLQLYALQHPKELTEYHHRASISNYYLNIGDFTRYRSQVLLQGDDAVLKWIQERRQDYSLHTGVVAGDERSLTTPYFFKNPLVGDEMYLAQAAIRLPQAVTISSDWNKSKGVRDIGYNSAKATNERMVDDLPVDDFTVYSYQNPTNIEPYICNKGCSAGENDGIKVLGYRNDENEPTYVSLLPLGVCNR